MVAPADGLARYTAAPTNSSGCMRRPRGMWVQADYRNTIGLLLADEDYLGRNWSCSVLVINDAGRDQDFQLNKTAVSWLTF